MTQKHLEKFLLYFLIFLIIETVVLVSLINADLFVYKFLINYLIAAAAIPFLFEKLKTGRIDPFSPLAIFTFFYLLLFGFRAIDQVIFNREAIIADEIYYIKSMMYSIIGLHFYQIGYFIKFGYCFNVKSSKQRPEWNWHKFKILIVLFSIISIFSLLVIIKVSGGFHNYFGNIRNSMVNITSGKTIFFISVILIKIPLLVWFCRLIQIKKISLSFLFFAGFTSILLMSLGERGHFITLIIAMIVCYHYLGKRFRIIPIVFSAMVLVLFLNVFGQYRDFTEKSDQAKKVGLKLKTGFSASYKYFIAHFDQARHFKDVIKYVPDELEFQYGKTFASFLVKPIPSFIWEGKPQGAGRMITSKIYPKANSLGVTVAPSLLSELYLNFHVAGIVGGMFVFGVVCRVFYLWLIKNNKSNNVIIIYSLSVPYIFSELRGDFNVVTSFLIFILVFVIISLNFITYHEKKTKIIKAK